MNTAPLETRLLQVLVALTEGGSVTAAATALGLSQPATSHALGQLRQRLNDPVVVRVGNRMVATPRAAKTAEQARAILLSIEQLTDANEGFDAATSTTQFAISAPEYVEHLLSPLLARLLAQEAPSVSLLVRPPDPRQAEKMLESGELDLRLGWVDTPAHTTRSRVLFSDTFVCLLRKGHPALKRELTLEAYAELPHVRTQVSMPSTASRQIDAAVATIGKQVKVALVVPSYLSMARVVAGTQMVATVPTCIADNLPGELHLVKVPSPARTPPLKVAMYWHERMNADARHRWLRSKIVQAMQQARGQTL